MALITPVGPNISPASAAVVGFQGPDFTGFSAETTGEDITAQKPESKLWFHDGFWWAAMLNQNAGGLHTIHYLDLATNTWVDTSVTIDIASSKEDVLHEGDDVIIHSRVTCAAGQRNRVRKYSYTDGNPGTWSLDTGFPVQVGNICSVKAATIVRDTQGILWVTYIRGGDVRVIHTQNGSDTDWANEFDIPVASAVNAGNDEISAIINFSDNTGPAIGVMYSEQSDDKIYFAVHRDSDPVGTWSEETALSGNDLADDHISIKAVGNNVYAATKTSLQGNQVPLIMALARSGTGAWNNFPVANEEDSNTRPIALLEVTNDELYIFMTRGEGTGADGIVYKKAPRNNLTNLFASPAITFIEDDGAIIDNPTTMKMNATAGSNIVVMASSPEAGGEGRYYWNILGVGGTGDLTPPSVTFTTPIINSDSPQTVSGTISDVGSGVDRMDIIAVDLGAAGATDVPDLRWWNGTAWGPTETIIQADITGSNWSFEWDPVPGGSGSYVIGLQAFDNDGNKWPANKEYQAIVVISDTTAPAISAGTPVVAGDSISWSGSATEDVAVRKVRMIIRHVSTNEYWNGTAWVNGAAPDILLTADISAPLSGNPQWSYVLNTDRTGEFQTLTWAQNGAFTYGPPASTSVTK